LEDNMTGKPPPVLRVDPGVTYEEVMELLDGNSVDIVYGNIMLRAHRRALEETREGVAQLTAEERERVAASVDAALRRALPKMLKGNFKKKVADDFHADLLLWTALREVGN
jgi:hypothetical protein